MLEPSMTCGTPRALLMAAAAALVVATAPAEAAMAASVTESSSTVVVTGVATFSSVPTYTTDAAKAAPTLFDCWAAPLTAVAKATPAGGHKACATDQVAGAQGPHTVGGVQVEAMDPVGSTSRTGGLALASDAAGTAAGTTQHAKADASARSAKLVVGHNVIDIGMMTSASTISCTYGASGARYSFTSTSTVHGVKINGRPVQLHNGTMDIKVAGGVLHLNASQLTKTGNVQQAAILDTKGAHVVISETAVALAPVKTNPCL